MSADADLERLEAAMASIRAAVREQLGAERPVAPGFDPAEVFRFSPRLPAVLEPADREALARRAAALDPWLQGPFWLGGDLVVGGVWRSDLRWETLGSRIPQDLTGTRVLDVGSNAGYDAFRFAVRGATVTACEPFAFHEQAAFLESLYETGVDLRRLGWDELRAQTFGRYDIVHCSGVLYHELHPMALLQRLASLVNDDGRLLLGSMILDSPELSECMRFVPGSYFGDPTWWWVPGRLALRWMLEQAGFSVDDEVEIGDGPPGEFPVASIYLLGRPRSDRRPRVAREASGDPPVELDDGDTPVAVRFPPGHFCSPLVDTNALATEHRRSQVWPPVPRETPGIDWRADEQRRLCREVFANQSRLSFPDEPTGDPRDFFTQNTQFPALDAWVLEAMLRMLRPRRMIEVGSGYSTLVSARTNLDELDGSIEITCIEPYPARAIVDHLPGITNLRIELVQDTPLRFFESLEAGDVLFVDTSHVAKTGGDVPWLYQEILPRLQSGVVIQLHDMFVPGEYPEQLVLEGCGWNELYVVRALLAYSHGFEVVLGAQWLIQNDPTGLAAAFPGYLEHEARGGSSLWLRRL